MNQNSLNNITFQNKMQNKIQVPRSKRAPFVSLNANRDALVGSVERQSSGLDGEHLKRVGMRRRAERVRGIRERRLLTLVYSLYSNAL